ncbi:MAG: PEP-CTERM sorting domain-containing protein [Armatimonadota bacterium]
MVKKGVGLLAAILLLSLISTAASAFSFDDIQLWAGSGSNKAALVIDWNDGKEPECLAWGYRWDGTATGRDMLNAVKNLDERLNEVIGTYGQAAVLGLGYDLDSDGFSSNDSSDHYQSGWSTSGFWSYWLKSTTDVSWSFSHYGISGRTLSDGCWDGWSFSKGVAPDSITAATSVPEPSSLFALVTGVAGLFGFGIRRKK